MTNLLIVGYGNVGKCVDNLAKERFNVVAIASRRKLTDTRRITYEDALKLDNVDVALLCLGSYNDIEHYAGQFASKFNTVDCYDNHDNYENYKSLLNTSATNTVAITGAGWDPGIMTIVRQTAKLFDAVPHTAWGEGISQGHSNALRSIAEVMDAVAVTVPQGDTHHRICYVCCTDADKATVANKILHTPYYFENNDVEIRFVSRQKVCEIKQNKTHHGKITAKSKLATMNYTLNVTDNALLTANVMLHCADVAKTLQIDGYTGAMDLADVMKYI